MSLRIKRAGQRIVPSFSAHTFALPTYPNVRARTWEGEVILLSHPVTVTRKGRHVLTTHGCTIVQNADILSAC